MAKRDFNFTHIVNKKYITDVLSIHGMPVNIFLDKDGKAVKVTGNVTMEDGSDFAKIIDKLMQ